MWREIYPKAPGNRNPRAISIIDSTRFKTPSVDLPLVPLLPPPPLLVDGGRPHLRRVLDPLPCGSFYSPLVDGRDDCHVGNLWSPQMPFEIRPIGWAAVDTCHASFATFTSASGRPRRLIIRPIIFRAGINGDSREEIFENRPKTIKDVVSGSVLCTSDSLLKYFQR